MSDSPMGVSFPGLHSSPQSPSCNGAHSSRAETGGRAREDQSKSITTTAQLIKLASQTGGWEGSGKPYKQTKAWYANGEIEVQVHYIAELKKPDHSNKLQIYIICPYFSVSLNVLDIILKTFAFIWPVSHMGT